MDKKKALILSYSSLNSDPRINRQIEALQDDFEIETSGYSEPKNKALKFYSIYKTPSFSLSRKIKRFFEFITFRYEAYYWDDGKKKLVNQLSNNNYDVIIANDIPTLPLALKIANNKAKVYFDAHEYHLLEFEDNFKWRLLHKPHIEYLCKKYIPKADAFSTVSEGIAKEYEKNIGVKPFLLTNASVYYDLKPSLVDEKSIKIIHHGAAIPSRKLELMIEMMNYTDERFTLDLMLTSTNKNYLDKLKDIAKNNPKIKFIPPVNYEEICIFINNYDIGLFLLPPTNFNYKNALPNKFFEFIQARLAIAIALTPEMKFFVEKYYLGVVADDFNPKSLAVLLNKLSTEQIMEFKENANKAATLLSAEENKIKIYNIVSELANLKKYT